LGAGAREFLPHFLLFEVLICYKIHKNRYVIVLRKCVLL